MQWMRAHTKIILWVVLAAFLGTIFLVWGMEKSLGRQQAEGNAVALIDGEPIPLVLFDQQWSQQVTQYRTALGGAFTEEMSEGLKPLILKGLIRQELLFREAKRRNIQITSEEVVGNIKSLPAFRTPDGRFDERKYMQALNSPEVPWNQVEEEIRSQLLMVKLRLSLTAGVRVTDAELKRAWQRSRGSAQIQAAFFSPAALEARMKIYDRDIKSWYEEHRSDYEKPETVTVRHILIGLKPGTTPEDEQKARVKIEEIRRQAKNADSFSRLAAEHSEDPGSAAQGGKLGQITRGLMVPEFERAAFALRKSELSGVVKTQYGLHIIYCDDHQEGKTSTFSDVKDKIRRELSRKKAVQLAGVLAQQFSERSKTGEAWDKIVSKDFRPEIWTGSWRKDTPLASRQELPRVSRQVFEELLPGETGDAVEDGDTMVVVKVVAFGPSPLDIRAFEKERAALHARVLQYKQSRLFEQWLTDLEKKSKIENLLKEFQKKSPSS